MYSFYILCKIGSDQDDHTKKGQAHMLEHFVILSMMKEFWGNDGYEVGLRGQTSYCYSLLSWRQKEYQQGKELMNRFILFVQNELLVKQHKYMALVSIARDEVLEEISQKHQETLFAQTDMIRNLSRGRILACPIGTATDVRRISEKELFDALRRTYRKENLEFFIFDYSSDKFVWNTMGETNFLERFNRENVRYKEKESLKEDILLKHKYIFNDRKIRVTVSRAPCHTNFAEGQLQTEFFPIVACQYLNQMWKLEQGFRYHPIYLRTVYGIERINIFQPDETLYQSSRDALVRNKSIRREALFNHFFSVINFPALKKYLLEHIRLANSEATTRIDCENTIIHFYGNPHVKINGNSLRIMEFSDRVLEDALRSFIKSIDQIQFFH